MMNFPTSHNHTNHLNLFGNTIWLISSFLLRIIWSITAYIHSTVLILDCSASTTILSTIASFFLMLFALLLANTNRNDDTTSNAKLINNNSKSISPVNGAQNHSILKGSLNNDLKKNDKDRQKNILTSVNCISATPSPISNQSPSSQQSQQQLQQTRHQQQYHAKPMAPVTSLSSQYNQQSPIGRSSSSNKQQQRHRHKRTNASLIV